MKVIQNAADEGVTILLYDQIGSDWMGEGVTAKRFAQELAQIKAKRINLRINSPGGSVFEGNAIYELLRQHKADVLVSVDGLAASAASVVAMAGQRITMAANAMMMIHDPWSAVMGNAEQMRQEAELLDKIRDQIAGTYAARTKGDPKKIAKMMADETWMAADEAMDLGFADEVGDYNRAAASVMRPKWFKMPENVAKQLTTFPGPSPEQLAAHERRRAAIAALKV